MPPLFDEPAEIAIGIVYSVIHAIGARLIERVLHDYPKVRLVLVEGLSGAVLSNLLSSEVELATIYNPPVDQTTIREPLLEEGVYCLGRASVIGRTTEPITFEELTKLPMILLGPGGMSRSLIDHPALLS